MSVNHSLRQQLLGAWELISYVVYSEKSASDVFYPLGKDARGIIMYTADGYMSAQLQRPGQEDFATAKSPVDGSESELAESAKKYIGYTGPFYLDETGPVPVLQHHFSVSSFPNWLGDTQKRVVRLDGDQLVLSLDTPVELKGELWNPVLTWHRLANNQASKPTTQ